MCFVLIYYDHSTLAAVLLCGRWFDLNRLNDGRSRTAAHLVVLDTATGSCDSLSAVNNGPSLGPLLLSHPLTPSASPGRPSGYSNDRNFVRQDNLTGDPKDPRENIIHVQSKRILIEFIEKWANFAMDNDWNCDDWFNELKACQPSVEDTEEFRDVFAYFLKQRADSQDDATRSQEHPQLMSAADEVFSLILDPKHLNTGVIHNIRIYTHHIHTYIHTHISHHTHHIYIHILKSLILLLNMCFV